MDRPTPMPAKAPAERVVLLGPAVAKLCDGVGGVGEGFVGSVIAVAVMTTELVVDVPDVAVLVLIEGVILAGGGIGGVSNLDRSSDLHRISMSGPVVTNPNADVKKA